MKKTLCALFAGLFLASSIPTQASGLSLGYGQGKPADLEVYRIGGDWHWHTQWLPSQIGYFTGLHELAFTHYKSEGDENKHHRTTNSISLIPLFRYQFNTQSNFLPFLEAGVGILALQKTRLGNRAFSSVFQFDDRVNVGMQFGSRQQYEITIGYNHVSNANIKKPNNGIDPKVMGELRYWLG